MDQWGFQDDTGRWYARYEWVVPARIDARKDPLAVKDALRHYRRNVLAASRDFQRRGRGVPTQEAWLCALERRTHGWSSFRIWLHLVRCGMHGDMRGRVLMPWHVHRALHGGMPVAGEIVKRRRVK